MKKDTQLSLLIICLGLLISVMACQTTDVQEGPKSKEGCSTTDEGC